VTSILIPAGGTLTAGQGQGQLSQYYGYADTNSTTVTAASAATNLSTLYTIPAGEPYAGASYQLSAAGYGTWGSTQQQLTLWPYLDATLTGPGRPIAATAFAVSAAFQWSALVEMTCVDGVSAWQVSWLGSIVQTANAIAPGTAADNAVPLAGATTSSVTAAVSSAITVALQAKWASTTGAPTLTCVRTNFRKVA
jgi:hypothetical protein